MAAGDDGKIIKLSLFSKVRNLKPLPGQERGRVFALTDCITPQPQKGMGYLVEVVAPRRVKVVAWLALGGNIFACDEPVSDCLNREAACGLTRSDDNVAFYVDADGRVALTARFSQDEKTGRLTVGSSRHEMGPYASGSYDVDEMGAACFVAHWLLPRERGEALVLETVGDVLDELMGAPYADSIDALIYRGEKDDASGFERFAARSLLAAGAEYVRPIAATHEIDLRRLASTGMFWTGYSRENMVDREVDTLQAVEGALNRLVFIDRMLSDDDGASPFTSSLSEDACEAVARTALCAFPSGAETRLRGCEEASPFSEVAGAVAARGGEWDLRTRFAAGAEGLRTPFGFDYTFDCDARAGLFAIDATVPASSAWPFEHDGERVEARRCYALRLSVLLAAVAFGAGVGVTRVVLTLHERLLSGGAVLTIAYDRRPFAMGVLPKVASHALLEEKLTSAALTEMVSPRAHRFATELDGAFEGVDPLDPGIPDRMVPTAEDERPLPPALAAILRADRVCDLDVYGSGDDPLRERFRELLARDEAGDPSVLSEVADLVSAYDAADALQGDDRVPLYCCNMASRVLAGGLELEGQQRFRKVPDSAFDARSVLCRMYRERDNLEDALQLAIELVGLAPTSFNAYHSLALVYRDMGKMPEAVQALIEGLKVASVPTDVACCYYRLGYFFWQMGQPQLGLACYALVRRDSIFYGEAQQEMDELMRENHQSRKPARDEVQAIARAEGVPLAPVSSLVEAVATAALGLVDAGCFDAALMLVHFLSSTDVGPNSYDVLASVTRSLQGVGRPAR